MKFKAKKVYGQSMERTCPFCHKIATQKNPQGLNVCYQHTKQVMEDIKCACDKWLEQRVGKFGPYFNCMKCGNISYAKAMEMKSLGPKTTSSSQPESDYPLISSSTTSKPTLSASPKPSVTSREITIRSDDPRYFD